MKKMRSGLSNGTASLNLKKLLTGKLTLLIVFGLSLLISTAGIAQTKMVTGKVSDAQGLPVSGATVTIKGTSDATASDNNGNFSISAAKGATLVITSVNYVEQEFTVGNGNTVSILLTAKAGDLGEVVVVGYGTAKKSDLTGSVARVNLETMANAPNTNIGQYLQGTVPGLNVGLSTNAGGTPPINIRGRVTISGSQEVVIILDGIQYKGSLSSINPDDIASIDILKDASATAVYGAQGANGVILITSKKGKYNQKPRIAFSSSYSSQTPTGGSAMEPKNREEFLQGIRDAFWNQAYLGPNYTDPNPAFKLENVVDASMATTGRTALLPNDFNWWKEGTNTGSIVEDNLSVSGGGDRITYLLSGGLANQKGYIINDKFNRKTLRANMEIKAFDWWKVGLVSSGSFVNQDGNEPGIGGINIFSPLLKPYDSLGNVIPSPTNTVLGNPMTSYYVTDYDRNQYYVGNVYSDMDIPFIKG
jgi:TonB-dependent SusC/RagA subfamily outer membrane receptor